MKRTLGTSVVAALVASVLLAPGGASAGAAPAAASAAKERTTEPIVIGHRGASGYRPEHTLASYRLAIRMGADYVEPDLVSTSDGVLVARHENEIGGTTDVADHPEFADRRTTKTIDGKPITGWFTEDFTLDELKTLRAKERLPQVRPDNTRYDGQFEIPTLDEVLAMVREESRRTHRRIGVYPETKHPTYFDSIGLSLEEPLLRTLRRHHLDRRNAPVILQSFETANLRDLDARTDLPIAQLIDGSGAPYDLVEAGDPRTYKDLTKPENLADIASYADGLGAHKDLVLPRDASGATGEPSALVDDAHDAGLTVHVWTLRDENQFMATNFRIGTDPNAKGDSRAEAFAFFDAGVDGVFTDYTDTIVAAREDWLAEQ
ncbi:MULTISPECIES: glycerophosphodiester phosphodiesterase [unclassified Nocardioides]|uniref:glycerophosphodiester phosphodiesterase n=1 Tax=unclassified Nocardioides TaxID=2615069 RepID=UPI0006F84BA0|nr:MULTISPECIES: glycerophosphodiester phosphodiesterase [unclassified Nocardioides]KQY56536.1 glycerophosphodiester phosphodiesterase [Nocardioides sp. Root140]KRF14371.1 glycerophosphodiester phosphodiesterase [Nocardioides sp. Soil796]